MIIISRKAENTEKSSCSIRVIRIWGKLFQNASLSNAKAWSAQGRCIFQHRMWVKRDDFFTSTSLLTPAQQRSRGRNLPSQHIYSVLAKYSLTRGDTYLEILLLWAKRIQFGYTQRNILQSRKELSFDKASFSALWQNPVTDNFMISLNPTPFPHFNTWSSYLWNDD